ncbi:hypothetical protein B9N43_14345 [Denitratisoma sp. DHT3]|uniref:hypothetical protein n=1 Tax=Denitratisoma sp. DHT3 TaxID=1981880 RepID=UPI001198B8E4|nr:hypothetical protein [Denitratisoma sp. DHT3]QDX82315.1 hypothetical protein B9N43_14345 [Denitratisoma sp. DHT3]
MKILPHFTFLLLLMATAPAFADTLPAASGFALDGMAPAGRWAARLTLLQNGYDHKFDNDGRRVDLDKDYDGLDLSSLNPFLGGRLRLGTHVVTEYAELMLGYGLTEDLTLGAIVPYARTTTHVRFGVDGGIGTAGMKGVLTALGYKLPRTTAAAGPGDPTLGALWRFHKTERDSAILGLGVRFGVAKADDPDDLFDVPPGDGSTDLRLRAEYFRDLGQGFDLRLLGEYQIQLPDHVTARPGNPLTTATKERLKRDLGDYWESDVELGKRFGNWRVSATWHRYREATDRYWSAVGSDTRFLSTNTATLADQLRLGVSWSGIEAWRSGRLPLPLIVKLEVQDAARGRNFVGVRDVYLRISTFF